MHRRRCTFNRNVAEQKQTRPDGPEEREEKLCLRDAEPLLRAVRQTHIGCDSHIRCGLRCVKTGSQSRSNPDTSTRRNHKEEPHEAFDRYRRWRVNFVQIYKRSFYDD